MRLRIVSQNIAMILVFLSLVRCAHPFFNSRDPVKTSAYWGDWSTRTLEQRIVSASDEMIAFIEKDNARSNFPEHPSKPLHDADLLKDIKQAVRDLPESVQNLLRKKLVSIMLIDQLGGTGFTDSIFDDRDMAIGGFILLDVKAIDKAANEWASWKENTPFTPMSGITLKAVIEEPEFNNRIQTIQYILLHEAAHVIAIGDKFHPNWDSTLEGIGNLDKFPFTAIAWMIDSKNSEYVQRNRTSFANCQKVRYYNKANLSLEQARTCYQILAQSTFVSLYASTNPFDDFAENFVFFVHKELLKRPWRIEIKGPVDTFIYEPSWKDPRFESKRKIIESLF